jgi:hypothetical protein
MKRLMFFIVLSVFSTLTFSCARSYQEEVEIQGEVADSSFLNAQEATFKEYYFKVDTLQINTYEAKRFLWQEYQTLKHEAWQEYQTLKHEAWQEYQTLKHEAWQDYQKEKNTAILLIRASYYDIYVNWMDVKELENYEEQKRIEALPEFSALREAEKLFEEYSKIDQKGYEEYSKIDQKGYEEYCNKDHLMIEEYEKIKKIIEKKEDAYLKKWREEGSSIEE